MTRNTKLSNISIAAIALFAASVPCFGQSQSADSRAQTSNTVAMANPELSVPFNGPQLTAAEPSFGLLNVEPKSIAPVVSGENPVRLSPLALRMRLSQLSAVENQHFFEEQTTIYESGLGNSKKQFRADDSNGGIVQKKRLSFVPSLGQKLPS